MTDDGAHFGYLSGCRFSPRRNSIMDAQSLRLLLLIASILAISPSETSARGCGSGLQVRAQSEPLDLSRLSEKQLHQLVQQLEKLQTHKYDDGDLEDEDEKNQDRDGGQNQDQDQDLDLAEPEDDHRGSSRPWNRVQRIIRRQLVKIPSRYLRRLLRQFGLARSLASSRVSSAELVPQLEEYYLIPLE
ncbi:uncharacterized protein LOC108097217 [Drosophila ficusphila]|uniref:uncharacterized protein LOC108097217 n=1 Tax=Drosophila ficusphila TaxID=30025 RepID=UPI0007E63279|nr:uncharacterized protein LOC108097217 [Drosophila ficusphila]